MKRRKFMQIASASMAGTMMSTTISSCKVLDALPVKTADKGAYQAIIIGSGYGGAVTALRLTQHGIPVLLLEMGMKWERNTEHSTFCKMITPDKRSSWLSNWPNSPIAIPKPISKYTGVLDKVQFKDMDVFLGRAYGGGSIVNGGISIPPRKAYVKEIFPQIDNDQFFEKYITLANKELKVGQIPLDFYNTTKYYKYTRAAAEQAKKAGLTTEFFKNTYDFDYMRKEAKGEVYRSGLGGEVIYGNNAGKFSLDTTYLKKAEETGLLSVKTLREVDTIGQDEEGKYRILVKRLNTRGDTEEKELYTAKSLFINAGSIGTSKLLMKAKHTGKLPKLNNEIGKHWGPNGNIMTGRNFVKSAGVKQSSIPVLGINLWDKTESEYKIFAEIAPLPMGIETWTTLYLSISDNRERANFQFDKSAGDIRLDWRKEQNEYSRKAAEHLLKTLNDANGGTRSTLLFNNGYGDDFCYHPLGGCALGKATDLYGRVKGYQNLYVNDSSLIPGSAGVNPFVFITALAERNINEIIRADFM